MNMEIIEFHPIERKEERDSLAGTLRIKLPDIGIHILGVFASKRNNSWFFALPGRQSFDEEDNKSVRYPFVTFEDRNKQRELIAVIREAAPAFIEARLADQENPLKFQGRLKVNPEANKQTRHQVMRKKKEVAVV